jgi:hypothetical protein
LNDGGDRFELRSPVGDERGLLDAVQHGGQNRDFDDCDTRSQVAAVETPRNRLERNRQHGADTDRHHGEVDDVRARSRLVLGDLPDKEVRGARLAGDRQHRIDRHRCRVCA